MDTKRNILAIIMVLVVILITPKYIDWITPDINPNTVQTTLDDNVVENNSTNTAVEDEFTTPVEIKEPVFSPVIVGDDRFISVETPLYSAEISIAKGGAFTQFKPKRVGNGGGYYYGGYDARGGYSKDQPVNLVGFDTEGCTPCLQDGDGQLLSGFSTDLEVSSFVLTDENLVINLYVSDHPVFGTVSKQLVFSPNSYVVEHNYDFTNASMKALDYIEFAWKGGLRPTEEKEVDDVQTSAVIISQNGEIDDLNLDKKKVVYKKLEGDTDWISIRSKYFISALFSNNQAQYGTWQSVNEKSFAGREDTPVFDETLGFQAHVNRLNVSVYLGPQDADQLSLAKESLENSMYWGWSWIRPISKFVLWLLKFLHVPFSNVTINYGIVLILFAFLIRIVTGPLMKKSAKSTQKMQMIQPKIKAVQAKFKSDPTKMNAEVMKLYKLHGVNPVGGCLPMLIQMPLLIALFSVFRNTIEFRGVPFFGWIADLSQPDVIFTLPFSIPIYGSGVAILPIVMGLTMFFQQKISTATADSSQKPMMYMMTGFFFLLFNGFPSGLNLYYAVSNILNIIQQKRIRTELELKKA